MIENSTKSSTLASMAQCLYRRKSAAYRRNNENYEQQQQQQENKMYYTVKFDKKQAYDSNAVTTENNYNNINSQQEYRHAGDYKRAMRLLTLAVAVTALLSLFSTADAASSLSAKGVSHDSLAKNKKESSLGDPFNRFWLKRSTNENNIEPAGFDDAVFSGENHIASMRPMLPDKWSNLFLTHQERSFFPTGYSGGYGSNGVGYSNIAGYGSGAFSGFGDAGIGGYGMEKRRRGIDDTPQFVENYINLVEPGRLEWNFNRL